LTSSNGFALAAQEFLPVINSFVTDLHLPLSQIRLQRYRPFDGLNYGSDLEMLTNYFWNIELAEALFATLHGVEVGLRNTIHATLTSRYQTEEWWHQRRVLLLKQHDHINAIEQDYLTKHKMAITPGRLIAELNFGFWTTILSRPYDSRIWRYRGYVLLAQAFPHSGGIPLADIHRRFNDIRFLRNRVMHYEAVCDRPDLAQEHVNIHQAMRWISPALHRGIHVVDDFADVFQHGRLRVYNQLHDFLGGP
jgi:hypothetical protein